MTTHPRPAQAAPASRDPAPSADRLAAQVQSYATLLAGRLAALRRRTDPAVAPLVAELTTAVEQLAVAEAALRAQRDGSAAVTAALATVQQELQTICDFLPDA